MGYTRHHAILVTSWDRKKIEEIRDHLREHAGIGDLASEIVDSRINGYATLMIAPDGSKEGWAESEEGNQDRAEFMTYLRTHDYYDGSSPLDWVLVQYGDEARDQRVVDGSHFDSPAEIERLRKAAPAPGARATRCTIKQATDEEA